MQYRLGQRTFGLDHLPQRLGQRRIAGAVVERRGIAARQVGDPIRGETIRQARRAAGGRVSRRRPLFRDDREGCLLYTSRCV